MRMPGVSARPKLVEPSGFDTAERAALAVAVAERVATEEGKARLEAAIGALRKRVLLAASASYEAEAAIKQAEVDEPAHVAGVLMGDVPSDTPAPQTVAAARKAHEVAEADCAVAKAALAQLEPQMERFQYAPGAAQGRCLEAARAVLRAEAGAAAQGVALEVDRLRAELARASALMGWLFQQGQYAKITDPGGWFGMASDPAIREALSGRMIKAHPISAPAGPAWQDTLDALQKDADAPIPAVLRGAGR